MKHVKILSMPDCDKLIYSGGIIARQIGALMVVDDEQPINTMSYPIVAGGQKLADGWLAPGEECMLTPVVCRVGEKISPKTFAKYVKMGMHEEVPTSASELYEQLRENGSDLQLPVMASTKETIREYSIELEINDFKDEAFCYSTDTAAFYFEAYFKAGDKDELYRELMAQLMDYMNILDTEELGAKITFRSVDFDYQDVIDRLNETPIDTINCDMYEPRKK
jgi:hypothetical protein